MIDLSSALLSVLPPTPAPIVVADGAVASPGDFARTLGAFLNAKDAALEPQPAILFVPGRQATAETGKDLPPETTDDAETPAISAAPLWFAALPLPAAEIAPAPAPNSAVSTPAISQTAPPPPANQPIAALPKQDIPPSRTPVETAAPATQVGSAVVTPLAEDTLPALQAMPTKILDAVATLLQQTPGVAPKPVIDAPRVAPDTNADRAAVPIDTPVQAIAVSTLPQPAGQVFASARAVAGSWREHASRSDDRDSVDVPTGFVSAAPIDLRERAIVHAAADTAHTALDLTADTGLQRMIDRIETLRDTADAGDTRVRLIPDALGSIDVAVRQDGDRVHVRFTAEHEATRALIAEAQPRLSELAAARGVRIGDTSVSTGTGGSGTAPQPQQPAAPPRAPASAMPEAATLSTDHRLA